MVPFGNGTWGSRSLTVGGSAIMLAADRIANRARLIAAHMLECAEEDLDYAGAAIPYGEPTGRSPLGCCGQCLSRRATAVRPRRYCDPGVGEAVFWEPQDTNDPQAIHLAVVLVDADTGKVTLRDYFTSDDCGVVINPMIVEGQVHGGLGQGIGQALMENVVYDHDGGGQLMRIVRGCMPRAATSRPLTQPSKRPLLRSPWRERRQRHHRRARRGQQRRRRCAVASGRAS